MRRVLLALFLAAALAQQATTTHAQNNAAPLGSPPGSTPGSTASGVPAYGSFGFDTTGMDRSVDPGDDFVAYANGTWQKTTPIPANRSNWGTSTILGDQAEQRVRDLIQEAAANRVAGARNGIAQKVGDFYAAFMDEAAIEKAGRSPVQPFLLAVATLANRGQFARALGIANRSGVNVPIRIDVDVDLKANDRYSIYLAQGGL